ncbi:UDP-glucose/GDP-mannose dehydrogenase family protein [Patescibacteria group bacterium]|nr:UDP-glucose/GDP-mannose dehydrogenase family protein [Patescibacteria group bacterium]
MKIAVIGTGYVGLVTGTCFAELGNDVLCVDIDEAKIQNLKNGIIPIYEPGLSELVLRNQKENRLNFTTDIKAAIEWSEVIFSAVGTPPDKDHRADLSAVKAVAKSVGLYLNGYKVFVNKSTVPVGTSHLVKTIIEEESRAAHPFDIVDNPEFLREGSAVKDFLNPDRIVCGVESDKAKEQMEKLYKPLVRAGRPLLFTDLASAEIIKYASNSFLATKISFINEVANFCELVGADITQVAKGVGLDDRIGSRFLHAGIGYGGSCFPKDVQAFIQTGKDKGHTFKILEAVEDVNNSQKLKIVEKVLRRMPGLKNKKIAIWGLAFKPKTDDMREAPSLKIIPELVAHGAKVSAFDPVASDNARSILGNENISYAASPYEAAENADAIILITEWDEFRSLDLHRVKESMQGSLFFDGRNIYDPLEMQSFGFKYESLGRPSLKTQEKGQSLRQTPEEAKEKAKTQIHI